MMMVPVRDIDFLDLRIALPAFLIICVTPLTYSISAGIFVGVAAYFILGWSLRLAELAGAAGEWLGHSLFGGCGRGGKSDRGANRGGEGGDFGELREGPWLARQRGCNGIIDGV